MKNIPFTLEKEEMYALTHYKLFSITPLCEVKPKDLKYINVATNAAEKSCFNSPMRLGACIEGKGQCLLCG
jgi:hypothetical protein